MNDKGQREVVDVGCVAAVADMIWQVFENRAMRHGLYNTNQAAATELLSLQPETKKCLVMRSLRLIV